jgi:hypothetical protein
MMTELAAIKRRAGVSKSILIKNCLPSTDTISKSTNGTLVCQGLYSQRYR